MAAKIFSWSDIPTESSSGGGNKSSMFLRLEVNNTYTLRLVLDPICYYQHWQPIRCRSPYKDPETQKVICPLMALGYEPKPRFSCWVLHREDGNALKLVDFSQGLAKDFKKWQKANGNESPGGMKGPDFRIVVEPGEGRIKVKYTCVPMNVAPFSAEEIAVLKAAGGTEGLKEKLQELRKDDSPEEIRKMMAEKGIGVAQPQTQEAPPSQAPAAAAPAAPETAAAPATPASDDDISF